MSYRVERSISNRAGCQATECKNAGIKIDKDELRLGVWVEFQERGGFQWRHWGCVSGKQLENIRNNLEDPERSGVYRWDYLDGYDGDDKGSLEGYTDLQEKVRRVITQGFIDPEDFNGDPEMNKLGEKGLRTAENMKKIRQDRKSRDNEIKELEAKLAAVTAERDALLQGGGNVAQLNAQVGAVQSEIEDKKTPKKTPASKKRLKDDSDDDGDKAFETPVKKKRAVKAKKEEDASIVKDEEGESPVAAPKKRAPRKKAVKKEEEAADDVKDEEDLEPETITAPKKKAARGKKVVQDESVEVQNENGSGEPAKVKAPAKKGGRKKAVKKEADDDTAMASTVDRSSVNPTIPAKAETSTAVKGEPSEAVNLGVDIASAAASFRSVKQGTNDEASQNSTAPANDETFIPGIRDDDLLYEFKHAFKAGEVDDYGDKGFEQFLEQKRAEIAPSKPKKKGGRAKKAAAPASKSTRTTRSSNASQA